MMITQKDIDDLVFRFKWSKESFKDKRVTDIYRQGIYDVVELFKQKNAMNYEQNRLKAQLAILQDVLGEYDGYRTLTNVIQNIEARIKKLEEYGSKTHD